MNVRKLGVKPWTFLTKPMNVRKVVSSGNEWSNQMRILRPNQTAAKVGVCDRQLRDLEAQGLFPKRFPLNPSGGRAVGHLENEVDAWIEARAASRDTKAA